MSDTVIGTAAAPSTAPGASTARDLDRLTLTAAAPEPPAALLDVRAVGQLLACSTRHVYRLADGGRMPAPVRLGALVRWRRQELLDWLAAGCPAMRRVGR
jgi:excisionase family DNA binding protein